MREKLMCVMFSLMLAGFLAISAETPSSAEIRTWYDLDAVRNNLKDSYVLMNDLDSNASGYRELADKTANDGKGWQPIGNNKDPFEGSFDGKRHVIRDLFINRPEEDNVGLFGNINRNGTLLDLGLANVSVNGKMFVGGLAGGNGGIISGSYATGDIKGYLNVGGLVGINDITLSTVSEGEAERENRTVTTRVQEITESYVNISCFVGNVSGFGNSGSLAGWNYGCINNSYSTGSVNGERIRFSDLFFNFPRPIGGLVGSNKGNISSSYSTGNVKGRKTAGGLVGENDGNVSGSFWDIERSGMRESAGGEGRTTAEMKNIATYMEWDIAAVDLGHSDRTHTWNMVDGETYPFLSWQIEPL